MIWLALIVALYLLHGLGRLRELERQVLGE